MSTPTQVIIEAAREDIALISSASERAWNTGHRKEAVLLLRFGEAIRDQVDEPKPLKRWRVSTTDAPREYALLDYYHRTGVYSHSPDRLQAIADALNAAEVAA